MSRGPLLSVVEVPHLLITLHLGFAVLAYRSNAVLKHTKRRSVMDKVDGRGSQEGVIQPVIQAPSSLIPKEVVTDFWNAIKSDNPILKLVLGLCSVLAISTSVQNALGMSLAATFVLVGSNVVISLIRTQIPSKVRIPAFIVVIASFVTLVDLLMAAYFPHLYEQLGIFIPLIVVNCIILARADAFAARQPVSRALADG